MRKTDTQIAADWQANILDAESCVNRYGNGRNLSDNAFSAAVSVTFRAGCGISNLSDVRHTRSGNITAACNQFTVGYGEADILPGLVDRAGKEKALCLDGA
jgi:lysozyme